MVDHRNADSASATDDEITEIRPRPAAPAGEAAQAAPRDLPGPGALLGDLRLGSLVGAGLTSQVYRAENLLARKPAAVKLLRPDVARGPVGRGRYVHEAKQVASLGIPTVADVFSFGQAGDGRSYTVLEWQAGTPLRELIAHNAPLSRRTFMPLARELCSAVGAVHAAGFAHRRLHGGNIFVEWVEGQPPRVKLVDFGVWHLHPVPAETSDVQRTAEHALCLAPEQAKGEPGDARSDVYALAVMLYQMLTGRPPFFADTFAATLELHLGGGATPPSELVSGIPAGLDDALLRALERDPRRRTPSPEAVLGSLDPLWATGQHQLPSKGRIRALTSGELRLEDLEQQPAAVDDGDSLGAVPIPELRLADGRPKKRRWLFIALAAAVLVFGGAIAFVLLDDEADEIVRPPAPRPAARRRVPPLQPATMPQRTAPPARPQPVTPPPPPPPTAPAPAPAAAAPNAPAAPAPGPIALKRPPLATFAGRKALRPPVLTALRALPKQAPQGQPPADAKTGTLVLTSGSPQTQFFLDGRLVGDGQQRVLFRIPAGPHRVHVQVNGRASPPRDIVLQPGQKLDVAF